MDVSYADASSFHAIRRRLFGIAYRTLGSVAEADEVVQDTWIRWQCTDRAAVRDASAFLATATARLALNVAQSARARHETPGIESLPEPVDTDAEPMVHAVQREELEDAIAVLLERLSPSERAAFVLREAFDYSYREIGSVLGVTEESARQLAHRARTSLPHGRRNRPTVSDRRQLLGAISAATRDGDLASLERFLRVRHDDDRRAVLSSELPAPTGVGETERNSHATDHRSRARRVRRVGELGGSHRSPRAGRPPVIAAANPLRGLASDAPAVSDLVRSVEGPSCSSPTPTGARSSRTSTPTRAISRGSCTSTGSRRTPARAAPARREVPRKHARRGRPAGPASDGTTDLYIARDRFHELFAADVPARWPLAWPSRSGLRH